MTDRDVIIASAATIVAAVIGTTGGACAILNSRIGDVNTAVDAVRRDMTVQIDAVRRDMTVQIDAVRRDMTVQIDAIRGDMTTGFEGVRTEVQFMADRVRAVEVRLGAPATTPPAADSPPAAVPEPPGLIFIPPPQGDAPNLMTGPPAPPGR